MSLSKSIAALAVAAAMALAACGGADGEGTAAAAEVPGGADPEKVEVIVGWAKAESSGDNEAAAGYFAIPSIAQNGVTVQIESAADAQRFSASLPCGAIVEEATEEGQYVIATFRLGEKANSNACGAGAGETARTAFLIEDGKIVEWRRVPDQPGRPAPRPSPDLLANLRACPAGTDPDRNALTGASAPPVSLFPREEISCQGSS